jgi:zinc transporter
MEDSKAFLYSYRLGADGTAAPASPMAGLGNSGLAWVHIDGRHPDARRYLKDVLSLDPLAVKSLLAEETRPRLDIVESDTLLILRGIHFNPGPEPEDLVSVRLWICERRVITVSRRKARAIEDLHERVSHGKGPSTAGRFVALLVSVLHDGIDPAISALEDSIYDLEERSIEHPEADLRGALAEVRKQAILFRRHIAPQRDVIHRLDVARLEWMSEDDRWQVQDNHDRAQRFVEDLDAIRERAQIVQDELTTALTARLNRNIYILSVITAVFMPLTFVTGLLGSNVHGIPYAESPHAFAAVCGFSALLAVAELWLLKQRKWV